MKANIYPQKFVQANGGFELALTITLVLQVNQLTQGASYPKCISQQVH